MTRRGRICRACLAVGFVVAVTFDWRSAALGQNGQFDTNGRNSRYFMFSQLMVRDYPGPRAASRAVVGAEIVQATKTTWLPEYRFRVGDIVDRIGDVPVRGAIHFARLWQEISSVDPTPVRVRRRGAAIVLRMTTWATGDLPPGEGSYAFDALEGWHASGHLRAKLEELTPSLQECLNRSGGVLVADMDPTGPGAYGGLRAGDILIRINGKRVENGESAHAIVGEKPGTLKLTVHRQGREVDLMPFEPATARKEALRLAPRVVFPGSNRNVPLLGLTVNDFRGGVIVQALWARSRGGAHGLTVRDVITSVSGVRVASVEMFKRLIQEAVRPSTLQVEAAGQAGSRTIEIALPRRRLLDRENKRVESIEAWLELRPDGGVWLNGPPGRSAQALKTGDRLVSVAKDPATSVAQVERLIAEWPANQPLPLEIVRDGIAHSVVVVPQAVIDESGCMDCGIDFSRDEPDVALIEMSPALAAMFGVDKGVFVTNVRHGSRAEKRGLRGCDVIAQIDGEDLPNPLDENIFLADWVRKQVAHEWDKLGPSLWMDVKPLTVIRDRKSITIR